MPLCRWGFPALARNGKTLQDRPNEARNTVHRTGRDRLCAAVDPRPKVALVAALAWVQYDIPRHRVLARRSACVWKTDRRQALEAQGPLFLPWLLLTRFVWHLSLLLLPESPTHLITSKLSVGRRLLPQELPNEIELVVDLTSEFEEPAGICERVDYLALPILDASAPEPRELLASMEAIDLSKHVLVHCAQGHGRTGLVAAVVLMMRGQARNADEALATLRGIRPGIGLSHVQMECLQTCEMILQRKGCYPASGSC